MKVLTFANVSSSGELREGQKVRVQLSKKKGSRAKVWTGEIVAPPNVDKRPREPKKKKKESVKNKGSKNLPAHVRKALTQLKEDEFTFSTGSPPPPIRIDLTSTKQLEEKKRSEKHKREEEAKEREEKERLRQAEMEEENKRREIRCREEAEEERWQRRQDERRRLEMEEEERWQKKREEWKQEELQRTEVEYDLLSSPITTNAIRLFNWLFTSTHANNTTGKLYIIINYLN